VNKMPRCDWTPHDEDDSSALLQPRYIAPSHIVAMIGSAGWGLDQRASSARLGTSSAEGNVPSRPQLPDSPAVRVGDGLLATGRHASMSGGPILMPRL
jgi:hypothetical protein